jgi:hypothetical protein
VEEVYVKAGDQVKAGDVLIKLNTKSVDSSILSAQADLATAQKELEDLLIASDEELAQAAIDLKDSKEAYDKAANYLKYLQTSQKVRQTETKIFIEETFGQWKYRYKTRVFKGPAPEDWIIEAENDAGKRLNSRCPACVCRLQGWTKCSGCDRRPGQSGCCSGDN